jgi:hypothetical protein
MAFPTDKEVKNSLLCFIYHNGGSELEVRAGDTYDPPRRTSFNSVPPNIPNPFRNRMGLNGPTWFSRLAINYMETVT